MDYVIRVHASPLDIPAAAWDALLAQQDAPSPFMQHAYLAALHASGSATPETGWTPQFVTLWQGEALAAASALYLKDHSYGEYVFDWAWANAYADHGLNYFPKTTCAVPFTPVPGSRLLAVDATARQTLLKAMLEVAQQHQLSSLHLLFTSSDDRAACNALGLMQRQTVQFHWHNADLQGTPFESFDTFLASLSQEKRKKIKQERRRVADAGVTFRTSVGSAISTADWDFFYQCYERTYLEHGNAPYLSRTFFEHMQRDMPENWVLFVAERDNRPIASSLVAVQGLGCAEAVAYGRYWGALERVDCLHFEACYYQPLNWCIANGVQRFEGGAQGEHKMARALMPVPTYSAHWLAHPAFADAVERFLERESAGVDNYLDHLAERSPFKRQEPQ
ncbi:GNAT family N-acetyltransferase [Limnohabitans curvus]|uniref:GNAT family N-acetyltransferase n=1 Tax=Limnohabitans curvus TaxID=323423 RepID=A0A315EJZ9_9BURK|nr:GNAT family N-acetyltransferase [Limnohabitans curvus]PUE58210.1 GNAT family N-acetyltransferase [Limnohabitans curvus]